MEYDGRYSNLTADELHKILFGNNSTEEEMRFAFQETLIRELDESQLVGSILAPDIDDPEAKKKLIETIQARPDLSPNQKANLIADTESLIDGVKKLRRSAQTERNLELSPPPSEKDNIN